MIKVTLNGKAETLEKSVSLADLLRAKKIRPEVVTVELNDQIIERDKYPKTVIKENDRLEFVYYMGGGGSTQPTNVGFAHHLQLSRTILSERKK